MTPPSHPLWLAATVAIAGLLIAPGGSFAEPVLVESPKLEKPEGEEGCCGKYDFGPDYAPSGQAQFSSLMVPLASSASGSSRVAAASPGPQPLLAPPVSISFTNSTSITITDCPNPCSASGQAASLYPSPITVSGVSGVVERVSVTINGLTHAFPADVDMLLVSPSGRKVVFMSDFGAGSPGVSNINLTLDDYADAPIPSTVTGNTGRPFVSGTYRPANSGTTDVFPAPAPGGPFNYSLSAFNGDNPNGTWKLYIIDDANLDGGSISGGWTLTFGVRPPAPAAGDVLISEFRTRGTGTSPPGSDGSADEFIELYNNTDQSITIIDAVPGADPTLPAGAGWRIAGAQLGVETVSFVIQQLSSTAGPLAIPAHGHFLLATQPAAPSPAGNTYSLSTYPTGTGITASGTSNVFIDPPSAAGFLPDNVGIALFSTATSTAARRLDSVGFSSVTNALYKEGAGLAPAGGITTASQHSWIRKRSVGVTQDTNNNAADFQLVETSGAMLNGVAATLGAPGPERATTNTAFTTTSAPVFSANASNMVVAKLDDLAAGNAAPNASVDYSPVTNGSLGTLKLRAKITNHAGENLLALRYRAVVLPTRKGGAAPSGTQADLRLLNSGSVTLALTGGGSATTQPLTLQTPATQSSGGGLNSSLSETTITTTAPLADGATTNVEFAFGIEKYGDFEVGFIVEALTVTLQGVSGHYAALGKVTASPADLKVSVISSAPDTAYTTGKTSILIDVLANDTVFPGRVITITSQPAFGTVTVVGNKIRYTPTTTLPVTGDSFTYRYNGIVSTVTIPNLSNITGGFDCIVVDGLAFTNPAGHERAGQLQLTVGATGGYTGSLSLGGVLRTSLAGSFLGAPATVKRTILRAPELPLALDITADPMAHTFSGTVQSTDFNGDAFTSTVFLRRRTADATLVRSYTMQISPAGMPRAPAGNGYAAVKITTPGDVTVAGKLADGAVITGTTMLMDDKTIPMYFGPYPNTGPRGSLRGSIFVPPFPGSGLSFYTWYKWPRPGETLFPNGINQTDAVSLVPYQPPGLNVRLLAFNNVMDNGRITISAGGFPVTIVQLFTLGTNNKATFPASNPSKVTLAFIPATGLFNGTFVHPVSKKVTSFAGAVNQTAINGNGYFVGATPYDAGNVLVEKVP